MHKHQCSRICAILLALIFGGYARPSVAQQAKPQRQLSAAPAATPSQADTIHVTSQLVVVDVVVTAKGDALRTNLTKDDFHVTENGVPQKIVHFEAPAAHVLPAGTSISSTHDLESRAPEAPVTVVVLDELNTRYEDMGYARYALEKYLNAQPQQLSAPTMLLAVSAERLQVLTDYTQDRAAILNALKKHLVSYPWELQRSPTRVLQLVKSLGALEQVAQATAGHIGHKNLLWVGHGFPGIDLSNPSIDAASGESIKSAVEQAIDMLRDSRMTLYTIDPTTMSSAVTTTVDDDSGPEGDLDQGTDPFLGDVNFVALAKATGGKSFFSRNDIDAEVGESARDGLNYYTLAYRPAIQSDAAQPYRKIRVTFTQPGLHASFRDGYYIRESTKDPTAINRSTYDIDSAIENSMVYTGLDVHAVERPDEPGSYVVGIPQSQLVWKEDGNEQSSQITVVAADIDAKGKVLRRVTSELTTRRHADAPHTGLIRAELNLPHAAGTTHVRFVVYGAGNGRLGSTDLPVTATNVTPATAFPK
jgi:VWFA-related protein